MGKRLTITLRRAAVNRRVGCHEVAGEIRVDEIRQLPGVQNGVFLEADDVRLEPAHDAADGLVGHGVGAPVRGRVVPIAAPQVVGEHRNRGEVKRRRAAVDRCARYPDHVHPERSINAVGAARGIGCVARCTRCPWRWIQTRLPAGNPKLGLLATPGTVPKSATSCFCHGVPPAESTTRKSFQLAP